MHSVLWERLRLLAAFPLWFLAACSKAILSTRVSGYILGLAAAVVLVLPAPTEGESLDRVGVCLRVGPYVPASKACLPQNTGIESPAYSYSTEDPNVAAGSTANYYLSVARAREGVGALSFGIEYEDLFVTFTSCTDGLEFPNNGWPASGGGNRITWTTCPAPAGLQAETADGLQVCFGAFYVYKYGTPTMFSIIRNPLEPGPEDDELAVSDCNGEVSYLSILLATQVGVGTTWSYNGCLHGPVAPATWGGVKSRYMDPGERE